MNIHTTAARVARVSCDCVKNIEGFAWMTQLDTCLPYQPGDASSQVDLRISSIFCYVWKRLNGASIPT